MHNSFLFASEIEFFKIFYTPIFIFFYIFNLFFFILIILI